MGLDRFRIEGRVALVTGASRGLGRAIAVALAEAGADLAAVSRRSNPELEAEIRGLGRRFVHVAADLEDREQTRKVVPRALEALGRVDILVNNAGLIRRARAVELSEADWDRTLELDLSAAFVLARAAAPGMIARGWGRIINVGSVLSLQGGSQVAAYVAAKHGLAGLTRSLANEWARHGVAVNALALGYFRTELTEALRADPARTQGILARTPAGRWGEPDDLAGAAVFLASPACAYVHGALLSVDGGWLAW